MRETVKRRRNFLPTLLVAVFFWTAWLYVFLRVEPESWFSFGAFYLSLFGAIFLTSALILANSRRAFFLVSAIIGFLLLRQFGLATILNSVLLLGIILSLEIYFSRRQID